MTTFKIPYGKTTLTLNLPDNKQVEVLTPQQADPTLNPLQTVTQALRQPLGIAPLTELTGIKSVAIAINDKTRPVPHHHLLPPLLSQLHELGLKPENITFLVAVGTHPPMTTDEFSMILPPEIIDRYPVISHDGYNESLMINLGHTTRGTPIWINRRFYEADLRLVVGNIAPHQFMGFSGGVKSAVIGLGGVKTINHNHAMMREARAKLGNFADNPARQDVEEIGQTIGVHFALNAILNESKQIVKVVAGAPAAVMHAGMPLVQSLYQTAVAAPFDMIIASPGGHPKDINVYQAQKGLAHAALVIKPGGVIVLVAACPEGTGSAKYEKWVLETPSTEAVLERFATEGFRVGPHKAFQIARDAAKATVLLKSEMSPDFVHKLLLTPVTDLQLTLTEIVADLPATARIGIMPWANATMPVLATQ